MMYLSKWLDIYHNRRQEQCVQLEDPDVMSDDPRLTSLGLFTQRPSPAWNPSLRRVRLVARLLDLTLRV